jgi:hypothetical protein
MYIGVIRYSVEFVSVNGINEERKGLFGHGCKALFMTFESSIGLNMLWSEDGTIHFSCTAHDLWAHNHTHVIKSALVKKR